MIKEIISKVTLGENLSEDEAAAVMMEIMEGETTSAQIAALLVALRLKGETVEEITGFAKTMRAKATPVKCRRHPLVDTCGTGGDGSNTFNISTAAALVLAGAGGAVAKHGNRSATSRCGSADVLEALGVNMDLTAEEAGRSIDEVGLGFLYAPALHGAMKHVAGTRREIGVRTVFNVLGPLTNPAGATRQVLGVYCPKQAAKLAGVLARLGTEHSFVMHGAGGLDEVSLQGQTIVYEVRHGNVKQSLLDPRDYGLAEAPVSALQGGDPAYNAQLVKEVLAGGRGPKRDAVVINAALALVVAGLAPDIAAGVRLARATIDNGAAAGKLEQLVEYSRACSSGRTVAM